MEMRGTNDTDLLHLTLWMLRPRQVSVHAPVVFVMTPSLPRQVGYIKLNFEKWSC